MRLFGKILVLLALVLVGGWADDKLVVGYVFTGPVNDAGFNEAQEAGRRYVEKNLPEVRTLMAEKIPENADAERVMEKMIRAGAKIIFASSYGYFDQAQRLGKKYPEVTFMHCGGHKLETRLGTYFAFDDEAIYLAGMAAGALTRSNKLGYVAAAPIPHILRSINAFTLGAQSVNPRITTTIVWTNGWNNPDKEASATYALADQGVDVVSVKVDSPVTVVQTAEKRGILAVAHYGDASRFAPNSWIVGTFQNWGPMMVRMIQEVEQRTWKPKHWLGDLAGGDIVLTPFGPKVTSALQSRIASVRAEFQARKRSVWQGPLVNQDGAEVVAKDGFLAPEKIPVMDFLVKGVVGTTH